MNKTGYWVRQVHFHAIPDEVVEGLVAEGGGGAFYAADGLLVEHALVSLLVEATVGSIDSVVAQII
jgi:hypothetical protein